MEENQVVGLIREIVSLLEEAERKFDDEGLSRVCVCLDCRKIYSQAWGFFDHSDEESEATTNGKWVCNYIDENPEYLDCFYKGHTLLELEAYEGPTDISGALRCLKWVLVQAEGNQSREFKEG